MEKEMSTDLSQRKNRIEADLYTIRELRKKGFFSRRNFQSIFTILGISVCLFIATFFTDLIMDEIETKYTNLIMYFFSTICIILVILGPTIQKYDLQIKEKDLIYQLTLIGSEVLQDDLSEDFFTSLVKINFKYIDKYYLQTQIQAENSFVISLLSACAAFLIIIFGIILMYFGKTDSAYIAIGSGVLSEFIAAIFFYLYNKSIIRMGDYHQKLVLTQNVSLALKITEQMPEQEKCVAQGKIIEELTKNINEHLASKR